MLPPTTILQEPSSDVPMVTIISPEQVHQIAEAGTNILWQPPPSENRLVTTAPFSYHNRRFRWYSTFMHTRNGYFRQSFIHNYMM